MIDAQTATDLAATIALLRYFPRRDPRALAAVAQVIREVADSPEEAQALTDAIGRGTDQWRSLAHFRSLAEQHLANIRQTPLSEPIPTPRAPKACDCHLKAPADRPARLAGITWAKSHCPQCPFLPTAQLIEEDDRRDDIAAQAIAALPESERAELEQRAVDRKSVV